VSLKAVCLADFTVLANEHIVIYFSKRHFKVVFIKNYYYIHVHS